jgi:hypothetical protein
MNASGAKYIRLILCMAAVEPLCHASGSSIRTIAVTNSQNGLEQPHRPGVKGVVPPFVSPTQPDTHDTTAQIMKDMGLSLHVDNGGSGVVLIAETLPENPRVPVVKVCISRPK